MQVNHRRGNVIVTQNSLKMENISTVGDPSRGEGMAEHMHMDMGKPRPLCHIPDYRLNPLVAQMLPSIP
jgi:hypothetical protein